MSFQTYIDNIKEKTKQTPDQIRELAIKQGILVSDLKATDFCNWLAKEYQLGRGHSMALWKYFIDHQWINTKHTTL